MVIESSTRAIAGVAAVFGIACALVKVLCGCRCHRGCVTIHPSPYHRLVCGSAEQQDG